MAENDIFENAVRTAERHAVEGRERIARQRELVERLEGESHERLLREARAMLADMERLQQEMEDHVVQQRQLAADRRGRQRS